MSNHELFHTVRHILLSNGFDQTTRKNGDHHEFRREGRKVSMAYQLRDRNVARRLLKQVDISPKGLIL